MPKYNNLIQSLEKPEKNICIYGLIDPNTNELKYIGQTIQGFHRIREHFYKCLKRNKITNCLSKSKVWIHSLKKQNQIFKVIYLEYFENDLNLDEAEKFYIDYFKFLGCKLLNEHIGASFLRNKRITNEERQLISIKTKEAMQNPLVKNKLKTFQKGSIPWNKGKSHSNETKEKISKLQENKILYIQDENGNIYRGLKEAATALNCSMSGISHAIKGRCKTIHGHILKLIKGK